MKTQTLREYPDSEKIMNYIRYYKENPHAPLSV